MTDLETTPDELELVYPPPVELPEFEGQIPATVNTRLTGTSQRITRPIHHGEKVILLVEASVADVRHPKNKDGLQRLQMLQADEVYELPGQPGELLLRHTKKAWRLATESSSPALAGFDELEGDVDGAPLTVDGNGVVLTGGDMEALGLVDADDDDDAAVADQLEQARVKKTEGQLVNRAPFEGYDKATIDLIGLWLDEDCPSASEAEHVRLYEEAHKGRKKVIQAAQDRVASFMTGDPS